MERMLLHIFQTQVLIQCKYVQLAVDQLNKSMQHAGETGDVVPVFSAIQNLLNAAANISKLCWGSQGKRESERKALRDSIGISNASPLREVYMRNNFEHFDERLERWWAESKRHNYVDLNIGIVFHSTDIIDIFRNYYPAHREITFWGQSFNLENIVNEVLRILPAVEAAQALGPWDTPTEERAV